MKILVSGAGGFVGQFVVDRLLQRGHSVRAIIRPHSPLPEWNRDVEIFRADLAHDDLVHAFNGIDAAIHLAVARTESGEAQVKETILATERFLSAMARSPVKRLVQVSSLLVYDWSRADDMLDENSPLLQEPCNRGPYTIAKVEQERTAKRFAESNGWKLTVLRPGFIWGPGHAEIAGMGRRFGPIFFMFGPQTHLPLCHVMNCADCIAHALESEAAINDNFNIIDFEVRVSDYVSEYVMRTGRPWIPMPIPYSLGLAISRMASFAARGWNARLPSLLIPSRFEARFKPLRFTSQKLRERLRWAPLLSLDACFDATYGSKVETPNL